LGNWYHAVRTGNYVILAFNLDFVVTAAGTAMSPVTTEVVFDAPFGLSGEVAAGQRCLGNGVVSSGASGSVTQAFSIFNTAPAVSSEIRFSMRADGTGGGGSNTTYTAFGTCIYVART
jgi:hypothetical protein